MITIQINFQLLVVFWDLIINLSKTLKLDFEFWKFASYQDNLEVSVLTYGDHINYLSELSHVTNANSHNHRPFPCWLLQYAQQDVAADLDLTHQQLTAILDHLWAKIANSGTITVWKTIEETELKVCQPFRGLFNFSLYFTFILNR